MNGDFSSRDIEEDCCRDINFMFLLEGTPVPDHAAFARFHTLHFTLCSKKILAAVQSSFTVSVRFREKIFLSMEQRSKSTRINTLKRSILAATEECLLSAMALIKPSVVRYLWTKYGLRAWFLSPHFTLSTGPKAKTNELSGCFYKMNIKRGACRMRK